MATLQSVKNKIQGLIDKSNETTGGSYTDLTSAVDELISGFGQGTTGGVVYFDSEDPGLKYFSYKLDVKRKEVILTGIACDKYRIDNGDYMRSITIPETLGGFNVVIYSDFQ